jgi:uncharacterized protein YceK
VSTRFSVLPVLLLAGLVVGGCGGAARAESSPSSAPKQTTVTQEQSTTDDSGWADKANAICRRALPDGSHVLIDKLDAPHVKRHGFAIIAAGSQLETLGPPPGADSDRYAKMIALYRKSAIYHALAVRQLDKGEPGNAAFLYGAALGMADKADGIATDLGATDCARFGMVT